MPRGLKVRKPEYIAIRDNTTVIKPDTIKIQRQSNYSPYGSIPNKLNQREKRMKNRPKPLMAKAGFTLNNRRYRNGGKTKC